MPLSADRLLFVTTENPFPPDGGGKLRTRGLIDVLDSRFAIDLLTYARPGSSDLASSRNRLSLLEVPRTVTPRYAAIRGLCRMRAFSYMCHADVDFSAPLRRLCTANRYKAVFIDNTMLGHFIPVVKRLQPDALLVTVAHNFETSLSGQYAAMQTNALRKLLFQLSAQYTERAERTVCQLTDLLLTTSSDESVAFAALSPGNASKSRVIPSFLSSETYLPYRDEAPVESSIIFPGDMAFQPNIRGALYFYSKIFPLLRRNRPNLRWWIAGKNCHSSIVDAVRGDDAVVVTGYVDDLPRQIARSAAVVVPLLHGSGTRLKILEAWALGRPVISTAKGCEGINCRNNHDIVIGDTPQAFADGVSRVLDDPGFAGCIARNATDTLLANYDLSVIGPKLMAALYAQ
jgi:glycosyltransferase involved in cell wall biosynthesis